MTTTPPGAVPAAIASFISLETVAKSGAGAASGAGVTGAGAALGAGVTGAGTALGAGLGAGTTTGAGVACATCFRPVCAAWPHEETAVAISQTIPTAIAFRTDGPPPTCTSPLYFADRLTGVALLPS